MHPREEPKKNLIKPNNRAGAASNVEGMVMRVELSALAPVDTTAGSGCELWLWAGSCTAPCAQPCSHWCHWLELRQSDSTSKSVEASERCLASEGTTLNCLHTLLDVKLTAQGRKIQASWHHYGHFIENICSLQSSGLKEKRNFISSPNDQWIPWSIGLDSVCKAKFSLKCESLDTAHWQSMTWACCLKSSRFSCTLLTTLKVWRLPCWKWWWWRSRMN